MLEIETIGCQVCKESSVYPWTKKGLTREEQDEECRCFVCDECRKKNPDTTYTCTPPAALRCNVCDNIFKLPRNVLSFIEVFAIQDNPVCDTCKTKSKK